MDDYFVPTVAGHNPALAARGIGNEHVVLDSGPLGQPRAKLLSLALQRLVSPAMLGLFAFGLTSAVLRSGSWITTGERERVVLILGGCVVSFALAATWLAFARWQDDLDLLSGRLAVAIPCVIWASQSISSPQLMADFVRRPMPSAIRVGVGVVGTGFVVCDLVIRERPAIESFTTRLLAAFAASVGLAAAVRWGFRGHIELQADVVRVILMVGLSASWAIAGVAELMSAKTPHAALRRCTGLFLLLMAVAQITAPPLLGQPSTNRSLAAGSTVMLAVVILLGGLICNLRQLRDLQRSRLLAAEFAFAQNAERLTAERLFHSRTMHDQSAALLSVEAVIKLLESSETVSPVDRHRLCRAATNELHRLRGYSPESLETELRDIIEPVVALANATGANVTMKIRPGLIVPDNPNLVDVVRNLISNALWHSGTTNVSVEARRLDFQFIELSVSDTGRGIPTARRFDLFEPGRSSGGQDHSGLGLHSARSLMRDMGGELSLDRTYVGGARFVARIPVPDSVRPSKQA